jgi:hypothetical protein
MAFSGQYAAAQLHHLPLPHSVISELSDYLGYAPNFAPPTYVKFARVYGRLPDEHRGWCTCGLVDGDGHDCCSTAVHWSDFRNKDFRTDLFGDCRVHSMLYSDVHGLRHCFLVNVTPDRVTPALYNPVLHLHMRDEDRAFFRRWHYGPGADDRLEWPYVLRGTTRGIAHPAINGAVRRHRQYIDWLRADRAR